MGKKVVIIGGGAAGLAAAYTLKKHRIEPLLLESCEQVGGRLSRELVEGFTLDSGADFFCKSYDVAFQICEELEVPLINSSMTLGWYSGSRWSTTSPIRSIRSLFQILPAFGRLGVLSIPFLRIAKAIYRQSEFHNFSSSCRMHEIDPTENFGEYLDRLGASQTLKRTLKGFLEMTMGHIEMASVPYMCSYLQEMVFNADKIRVPEKGAGALADALAENCIDSIRVSTPVRRVNLEDGAVKNVVLDDGVVEPDAVICALPASRVTDIVPGLPEPVRQSLGTVHYSTGCRVVIGLDYPPLPPGWTGALYPEDETPLLLDRSINLPACVPPGKSTLDLLVGRERAEEMLPLSDEEIKHRMLSDARRNPPPGSNLPGDSEGLFTRVYRWREAVCMAPPGMFKSMADIPAQLKPAASNLFLAGDYMKIPCVNGALASGVDAANKIADTLSTSA